MTTLRRTLGCLIVLRVVLGLLALIAPLAVPTKKADGQILPYRKQIADKIRDLEQRQNQPAPQAPAPQQQPPIIIYPPLQSLPIQGQPYQQLPIQGQPLQPLPIQGQPLQPLPPGGSPLQPLPPGGSPLQPLPIQGQPPQQLLPQGGPPAQPLGGPPQSYSNKVMRALWPISP